MNAHALGVLEFAAALEKVAERTSSLPGRERILALRPDPEGARARTELSRVEETVRLLESRPEWAPPLLPDLRAPLARLGIEGTVFTAGELLDTLRLLRSARLLAALLPTDPRGAGADPREPAVEVEYLHLARLRARLPDRPPAEERISRIVDEEGTVRDRASAELSALRRALREARGRIVRQLERLLASLPDRIRVEGASVSIREGRYVLPVRREGRGEVGGIVHGESATGATLFIEPPLAIALQSELHELERKEAAELQRILRETTEGLRPLRGELEEGFDALVDFDTLWARARTARSWRASHPELLDEGAEGLRIVEGRHPLLLEQGIPVVPFSLELDPGERAVVVSGPNTGGKTVFLKAVGLIHLLAQSGILPPVSPGTRLPLLRDLFADIGDEQSLAASLSTFSGHLANLREILAGAGPGTLVLIDEMGTGTDPAEGAALARALLESLVERGARAIVTSHLGALKRLDAEGSGIVNASLAFDADRIEPTYHLQKGRPGRSYGLAIARRLGLPSPLIDRAEGYLDSGELRLETLLSTLEERERALSEALHEAEVARREAEEMRRDSEARRARVGERERTAEARARDQARRLLLEAREEVERAILGVRAARGGEGTEAESEARRRIEVAAAALRELPEPRRATERAPASPLAEGDRVELIGSGARGVVLELAGGRATVEVGGVRVRLPLEAVEPLQGEGAPDQRPSRGAGTGSASWILPDRDPRPEVDLRGLRVEEVELALGRALDDALISGLSELRVIHGKGTGAVKARVLELLRGEARIAEFRGGGEGEGGGGVTVVALR